MEDNQEEKIPHSQVLDDMYNPDGGFVSLAARDYYYQNYASNKEKEEMDKEDKRNDMIANIIIGVMLLACIILGTSIGINISIFIIFRYL